MLPASNFTDRQIDIQNEETNVESSFARLNYNLSSSDLLSTGGGDFRGREREIGGGVEVRGEREVEEGVR